MIEARPIVSIIIAFYNEEVFLGRCLQSVKNQTCQDFELVLINDGSTDQSMEIAEKFRNHFPRIKIINTENNGHSQARNVGLQNASGEFLTFLDADDELEPQMIAKCLNQMLEKKTDLLVTKFAIYDSNGQQQMIAGWKERNAGITRTKDLWPEMFNYGLSENIWAKVFKSDLAQKIVFEKGLWFDDRPFLLEYLFIAQTVAFVDEPLLKIHKRNSSITRRTLEPKRLTDTHRVFELERRIAQQYAVIDLLKVKIAKHHLDGLSDHFLLQILEQPKIKSITTVRETFLKQVVLFREVLSTEKINLRFKDQLLLRLLELPKAFGWRFSNQLMKILKAKRIQGIRKLK